MKTIYLHKRRVYQKTERMKNRKRRRKERRRIEGGTGGGERSTIPRLKGRGCRRLRFKYIDFTNFNLKLKIKTIIK